MTTDAGDLEGIADELLTGTGCDTEYVDAFELATLCGVTVRHGLPARLVVDAAGDATILFDVRARRERQHGTVVHELAHWALLRAAEPNEEPSARYLAGALLAPRRLVESQLRAHGPLELAKLKAGHPNASVELLARRVAELRDAVVSIVDADRLRTRVASPWLPRPRQQLDRLERMLVDGALEHEQPVRARDVVAFPVIDGRWRRVVVVHAL